MGTSIRGINKMFKKSQVGVFILLGLILVIGMGFVLYLKNFGVKNAEIEKVSEFSIDIVPIKNYAESCIEIVGRDGISLIGQEKNIIKHRKVYIVTKSFYIIT